MGAFCCCPCGEDFEEYTHPSSLMYRHCICIRGFFHQLCNGYNGLLPRLEGRATAPPGQGVTPLTPTSLDTASETYQLVLRPAPYDTDPQFSRSQLDGLVSRREKGGMAHNQEEPQMLRRNNSSTALEHLDGAGKKWNGRDSGEESKATRSELEKNIFAKMTYGTGYTLTSTEDEDVCPTCLDEYTPENPKIVTKCSHNFHLGCIYEWMERSVSCPICGKEMVFCESP